MFDSLKKKLSSFFGKEEEKAKPKKKEKIAKAKSKKVKKEKTTKKVNGKKSKNQTKEITLPVQTDPLLQTQEIDTKQLEEISENIEVVEEKSKEEKQEVKRGFFASIKEKFLETPKIEEKIEETESEKEESFISKIFKKVTTSTITLTQENIDEIFSELEIILLENNTALEVVDAIKTDLQKDLVGIEVKKEKIEETIKESLKNSILNVLIEPPNLIDEIKKSKEPYVILFFGINGSGKTTSISKLANLLQKNNISCVLGAGDTFRAASIEQLATHASRLNVPIVKHDYGSDPAAVAFDTIKYAKTHDIKAVLVDTAGRMYTKSNLMKEMEKIVRISKPNLKIFVAESITGNDAVDQAKTFNETIGIDGIILTKADVDEKAGTILSVSKVTNKPIYFLGTGQSYSDFTPFTKKDILKNLGLE